MSDAILDIKRWGNSLGVRLPVAVAKKARLHADQRVKILVEGDCVVISPVRDAPQTLEQRLAQYDPKRYGGEQMETTQVLGAERW